MSLGTDHISTTTADVMIPEIWGNRVNNFYRANLKAGSFFEDWSEDVAGGGDIVHIPNISEMSASGKTAGSQVSLSAPTETDVDLTINVHTHVAFILEDVVASKIKSSYKAQEVYAKNAGYSVAAELEDALLGLFTGFSNIVGDSATDLNDSNIRQSIAYLDAANVPMEDRAFFLHPNVIWTQLMGIDKFTLVQNTLGADPVLKGQIGYLYNIPVIGTSRLSTVTGHKVGALAHKSAIAFATANIAGGYTEDKVRLQKDYKLEYLGWLVVADLIYGVTENRNDSGVYIKASS
jgi:hypothetical protein